MSDLVLIGLRMVDVGYLQMVIQWSSGYLWVGVVELLKYYN